MRVLLCINFYLIILSLL